MTIAESTIELMESNGAVYIQQSTVWDFYSVYYKRLGENKSSNVYKDVAGIFSKNPDVHRITAIIGAKGRTQHSATQVLLFDTTEMSVKQEEEAGFMYRCVKFFSHNYEGEK